MVTSANAYFAFLALIAAERAFELRLSRRNAERALARGGIELGREHLAWMRALHAGFLVACALEVALLQRAFDPRLGLPMLALALAAQALRYWAIATLGPRWNVRVIVVPGEPVVTGGPYRWLRHPNYAAVVLEGLAIPLIHGAWLSALAFSTLNAWLLRVRIRVEERALAEHCELEALLGDRPRLLPLGNAR
ncbi:MAG TPA: isoprenylcysteine carboxylmethyltransferase family protein [Myxococcota bacterium]|jgi:methyltransferase